MSRAHDDVSRTRLGALDFRDWSEDPLSLSDWTSLSQLEEVVEPTRAGIYALSRDGLRVHHLGRSAGHLRNRIRSASSADRGYKYFRHAYAPHLQGLCRSEEAPA